MYLYMDYYVIALSVLFNLILSLAQKHDNYLAMCLIVKDESDIGMRQWVEYHYRMGTSKFYIYDHNSTKPMKYFINDYIAANVVEYVYSDLEEYTLRPLNAVYHECLTKHSFKHNFMAFIDSDEYIVVVDKTKNIPDILKNYENYGGVALNWMMFGSSNYTHPTSSGVIGTYDKCISNYHVKMIINTKYVHTIGPTSHVFHYKQYKYAVTTDYQKQIGPYHAIYDNTTAYDIMYINHYNIRSLYEYKLKMKRGRGRGIEDNIYNLNYFNTTNRVAIYNWPSLKMPKFSLQNKHKNIYFNW